MRIKRVLLVPSLGSYWCEDVSALQEKAVPIGERYSTPAKNPSFKFLREPGEAVSIGLVLEDHTTVWGDAVAVAYGGKAGRTNLFRAQEARRTLEQEVVPYLQGRVLGSFRQDCKDLWKKSDLDPALRYGVSQALLSAHAAKDRITPTEVICAQWDLPLPSCVVRLHAQCGTNRKDGADRMIARRLASLPHSLVDDIPEQLGADGEKLVEYGAWLSERIQKTAPADYQPVIHLDVHGAMGKIFPHAPDKIVQLLGRLEAACRPYALRLESAVVADTRDEQIQVFRDLTRRCNEAGLKLTLVVDEWANTLSDISAFAEMRAAGMIQVKMPDVGGIDEIVEALLVCRTRKIPAMLGGSCNETDISARLSAHVALATQPEVILAKPGMGIDEGIALINNEMVRTLAVLRERARA